MIGVPAAWILLQVLRLSSRKLGVALVYHGISVLPARLDTQLSQPHDGDLFERQLRHVSRCYQVVPAREVVTATAQRRCGQRFPLAVTFDDDLRSHRRDALPALERLGLTATFFVCGASLHEPFAFWWERLNRAVALGVDVEARIPALAEGLPAPAPSGRPERISQIREFIQRLPLAERNAIAEELGRCVGPDPADAGMRAEDIEAVARAGCEIGFHTLRHQYLPLLDDDSLHEALSEGREQVAAVCGTPLTTVSYPHGGVDSRVADAAREAGYHYGFSMHAAAIGSGADGFRLGRIVPSFQSVGHLALRLVYALVTTVCTDS